jgi:hypothetical protein
VDNFGFNLLMDIYVLLLPQPERERGGHEIHSPFIKRFQHFGELEKYASSTADKELEGKIQIVKTYRANLPMCLTKIREKCIQDLSQAGKNFFFFFF